jgi:hydrogenase maturation protease
LNTTSQEATPVGTLVLALGNPLRGDDGIGAAILEALARSESLPQDVTLLDGGVAGLETALLMQGHRRAIIIDAAEMGLAPGGWARFTPEEVAFQADEVGLGGTLHSAGLAEALALGSTLEILPPEIAIYGVQPAEVGWSPGLSNPVQRAVSPVCTAILEELYNTVDQRG